MNEFYDSSAFTKLFLQEEGTEAMLARYQRANTRTVSRLAFLEVRSAIRRLEFDGALEPSDATFARQMLDKEFKRLRVVPLDEAVCEVGQELLERRSLRTLDALQLASALSLLEISTTLFVTSDRRLAQATRAEGFSVEDPRLA